MCGDAMHHVHVITNGGLWFCESEEYIRYHMGQFPDADAERMREINRAMPMHCVIPSSGYTKGSGTWPKDGLWCAKCRTIAVKTRPS